MCLSRTTCCTYKRTPVTRIAFSSLYTLHVRSISIFYPLNSYWRGPVASPQHPVSFIHWFWLTVGQLGVKTRVAIYRSLSNSSFQSPAFTCIAWYSESPSSNLLYIYLFQLVVYLSRLSASILSLFVSLRLARPALVRWVEVSRVFSDQWLEIACRQCILSFLCLCLCLYLYLHTYTAQESGVEAVREAYNIQSCDIRDYLGLTCIYCWLHCRTDMVDPSSITT